MAQAWTTTFFFLFFFACCGLQSSPSGVDDHADDEDGHGEDRMTIGQ